jgi:hypothetical protein
MLVEFTSSLQQLTHRCAAQLIVFYAVSYKLMQNCILNLMNFSSLHLQVTSLDLSAMTECLCNIYTKKIGNAVFYSDSEEQFTSDNFDSECIHDLLEDKDESVLKILSMVQSQGLLINHQASLLLTKYIISEL